MQKSTVMFFACTEKQYTTSYAQYQALNLKEHMYGNLRRGLFGNSEKQLGKLC